VVTSRSPMPSPRALAEAVDVTDLLQHKDGRFVSAFKAAPYKGFAELHTLTLDLPSPYSGGPMRLLMHGLTDYFTATSVYAAHQTNVVPVIPYVEALSAKGEWVRVAGNIGFPAGLRRTMTADLTRRLPLGARAIRIVTNLMVSWDQILFDTSAQSAVRSHELPLASAALRFHGYPREEQGHIRADISYDYQQVSASGPYTRHSGAYTRYGPVHPLLAAAEDEFVILGSGDEIALEFDEAPPVPPGWKRDYFFFARGYSKDMDFYEAQSFTVEPLPYAAMDQYPSAATRRDSKGRYLHYRVEFNTREETGDNRGGYRFVYHNQLPTPTAKPR
jgi:hypothetical protein